MEKATGDWHCVYLKVSDQDGQARTPGMTLTTQAEHAHCTQPTSLPCHLTPPWDARQEPALACSAKLMSGTTSESPGCPPTQDIKDGGRQRTSHFYTSLLRTAPALFFGMGHSDSPDCYFCTHTCWEELRIMAGIRGTENPLGNNNYIYYSKAQAVKSLVKAT